MKSLAVILTAFLLAGCVLQPGGQPNGARAAAFCIDAGYEPGTAAYSTCWERVAILDMERQKTDFTAFRRALGRGLGKLSQPPAIRTITCTQQGVFTNCSGF